MRNFNKRNLKKLDWSISLSVLLGSVLTIIAACVDSSGPIGAPDVIPAGTTVSSVKLTLAQPTLILGQTTQATVVATLSDGSLISGPVDYSSQNPSVATVSTKGVVTALTAGVAMINAAVASHAASATITVKPLASPIANVAVALDSPSLGIGHSAKANATVKDSAGNLLIGQLVTWASLAPTVATVSSTGMVTAVAAGSATIEARAAGQAGSASLAVIQIPSGIPVGGPGVLASHDFNDGTRGSFNISSAAKVDFPDDPTGMGHGKVARIRYSPIDANRSDDEYGSYRTHDTGKVRYGRTIWFKGDFYLPRNPLSDPNWDSTNIRKILDWQGGSDNGLTGGGARFHLSRHPDNMTGLSCLSLEVEGLTTLNGVVQPATIAYFAQFADSKVTFDTWHTLEVRLITNSANGVADGSLAFWLDNSTDTPTFVTPSTLYFINEAWAPLGTGGIPVVGSYFNDFHFGTQLSNDASASLNTEYRYWDNVSFSTARLGN
jgi:hypothetical protein